MKAFACQEPLPFPYLKDGPDGNQVLHTETHIIPLGDSGFSLKQHPQKGTVYVSHNAGKVKARYIEALEKKPFAVLRQPKAPARSVPPPLGSFVLLWRY